MLGLRRRARLPHTARAALHLGQGERILAYAPAGEGPSGGRYAIATNQALHTPAGLRVGWEHIEHAEWRGGVLHVRETAALGESPRVHHLSLGDPGSLPDVVHERVTASIAISQYAKLDGSRGVRVVGRRGADDEIVWTLVFDAELDPNDPETRARAQAVLASVREQTGL